MLIGILGCSSSPQGPAQSNASLEAMFEEGVAVLRIEHNLANISERVNMLRYYLSVPTATVPIVEHGIRMKPYLINQAESEDPKVQILAKALLRIINCEEREIDGPQESGTISLNGKPYRAQFTIFALNYLNEKMLAPAKKLKNDVTSSEARPEKWIEVQVQSPKYKEAVESEVVLIGRIAVSGCRAASEPVENTQWSAHVQMGNHPWLAVDNLSDYQKSFNLLRGNRVLRNLEQAEVLIKGKLTKDPSGGGRPLVMVGWMRELLPDDRDWIMPWQVNLPLLPLTKDKDAISHIISCQAIEEANSQLGFSAVHHASQTFKIRETLYGQEIADKKCNLNYSYLTGRGRDLKNGESVIWILTKTNDGNIWGYGAIPDTPNNRLKALELADSLKASHQERVQQNAQDKE